VVQRILVVDDSPTIRLTVRRTIEGMFGRGVQITEAASAAQAISEFRTAPPDIVFLDMMLFDGSGNEVLRLMLSERPEAKVVLLTGLGKETKEVVDAISWGAFSHIQKPVRAENLRRVIAEIEQESGRAGRVR
jgi:DNA-binding NtrC family response regulator